MLRRRQVDFTQSRQDGFQYFTLVVHYYEEASVVAEDLDTASHGRLRIDGELVGIQQHDTLEKVSAMSVDIDVCFREELELFPDKLDALAMSTIDIHDIFLDGLFVLVELLDKPIHQCFLSRTAHPIKQEVRNFPMCNKVREFVLQVGV
jgi:hypothetical protein